MRQFRFKTAALFLAASALPLVAQTSALPPEEQDDWAKPPIIVVPSPDHQAAGIAPALMRNAYGFSQVDNQGAGQTIALIDAYDNPRAESDLAVFSTRFHLPACTTTNGCFQLIYATGTKPAGSRGWAGESSLDIEWAHAIAPAAKIILVESSAASYPALLLAVDVAVQNGASVVSMSWGGAEFAQEVQQDAHFSVANVVFCASSGDAGHGPQYPAASPNVVAVGGTDLHLGKDGVWVSETAWGGSGGGVSRFEAEPAYQLTAQTTGKRGIPDVAYDASPGTGVPVYSKYGFGGWIVVGGTSMSSPEWAALFAIANSLRVAATKTTLNQVQLDLYLDTADFHDITTGKNGTCGANCKAGPGYDLVTGLGSPQANLLIPALVAAP